jgi:PAS domain S-box-containing protein
MNFSVRRDLGLQLLALYLLFVGPVVLATLAFDRLASERMEADVKASDLAVARAIAQETNTLMESALQAIRQLATYPAVIEADSQKMEELFRVTMGARPDINLVYRLDAEGIMLYHYPTGPGSTLGWDFSVRNYYQRARNTHNPLLSEGRISPTTEQPVATAVMPIWSQDGSFLGLVGTNIKLQSLSHTLAAIASEHRTDDTFEIDILDSAGQVIANPSPRLLLSKDNGKPSEVTQAVLTGQSGSLIQSLPGGEEVLFSYVPIPSAGWGVIVSRPTAVAFATPRATHRAAQLTVIVFIVVGLIFWFALSRQVIRPLERLAALSQTIGMETPGGTDQELALEKLATRSDQIGHLLRSLRRMERAIQARLKELSTLLETSASVVSTLDSQTVLDRILEQVERLMDIHMCAIVALDERNEVFRAQASRGLSKRYTDHLTISPSEPQSVTLRAIRTGNAIQVSDTEQDPSFAASRPRARSEGYRSLLAVPLKTQHAPPSALLVYRPDPHVFSEREINLLTSFANHAAMAIENATLYAHSDMRLTEQTRRLEALIQSMQDGLILEDLQGRVLYANRRIGELVGLPHEEIIGNPVQRVMDRLLSRSIEEEKSRAAVDQVLEGQGNRRVEIALETPREVRYLRLQVFDVTDPNGTPLGRGQIMRDITQNREIDRMKSSLISTVSHELRTPLAAIKGYASTLLAEDVQWDPATQREFLDIISNESDRLSALVDDLLDMSRIEAGNLIVTREECNLEELVYRAARRSNPPPGERLQVNIPHNLPACFVDPQRIEVVLRNLLENAAKYAGDHSPICISASLNAGAVVVRVEDQGPGIPAKESQRIFESFYRVESGLTRSAAGAGLGLAISQGFVRAHGGEIWIEPRSKGTCVVFSLPLQFGSTK